MRKLTVFLLAASLATFAIGCGNTETQRSQYGKARDFELNDINDNEVKLSDYSGKVIILNFFATWCPPCRVEMPDFNRIQKKYAKDVKVIAVNVGRESAQKLRGFARSNNLEFSIVMDDGAVARLYGPIPGIPVTVIIDRNFNIARRYVGLRPKEVFVKDIEELLR
ncbi:MAG: TlpA disulfide reductase family protein [Candidatus Omnitrophota bacterium]